MFLVKKGVPEFHTRHESLHSSHADGVRGKGMNEEAVYHVERIMSSDLGTVNNNNNNNGQYETEKERKGCREYRA